MNDTSNRAPHWQATQQYTSACGEERMLTMLVCGAQLKRAIKMRPISAGDLTVVAYMGSYISMKKK